MLILSRFSDVLLFIAFSEIIIFQLARLKTDAIQVALLSVFVFALHVSTMFTVLQPYLARGLHFLALIWGFILHYLLPQVIRSLRKRQHSFSNIYLGTDVNRQQHSFF